MWVAGIKNISIANHCLKHPSIGHPGGLVGACGQGCDTASALFDRWEAEVKATVPSDRLLEFNVKEGWAPLCKFLGIDEVPEEPFPRLNDTEMINVRNWNKV